MNIVENVARGSYDYISIAQTIRKLRELGATPEELERIFPWKKRWIQFIEDLQDLPEDVAEAIANRRITPTHVMLAANLPTPYEVHDGLKTAINLGWDTGTFKTFVQNRVEQIARAKQKAAAEGVEPEIPPAVPEQLIRYKQCLLCGYKKPAEQVTVQLVCQGCVDLIGYITHLEGPPEDAKQTIYAALQAYYGAVEKRRLPAPGTEPGAPREPPTPAPPPTPPAGAQELQVQAFNVLQKYRTRQINQDQTKDLLLRMGYLEPEIEKMLSHIK